MAHSKQVVYGFLAMGSVAAAFITLLWTLELYLPAWVGLPLFLVLAIPFALNCAQIARKADQKVPMQIRVTQVKTVLMALPGAALACWFFDVLSTVFVVDLAQSGTELNPLGWPFSAPAALAYYLPIIAVTYFLLFKIKTKASFYAAATLSAVTAVMGGRNFFASLNNIGPHVEVGYAASPEIAKITIVGIWIGVVSVLAAANIMIARGNRTRSRAASAANYFSPRFSR